MDYFNEPAVVNAAVEWYADCYNRGGRRLYLRTMSHYGSCSAKVPCDITSDENTIIYEHVCA